MLAAAPRCLKMVVLMTTHHTLKGEKLLKIAGVRFKTIMKPRYISSDCGLALTFEAARASEVKDLFNQAMEQEIVGFFAYEASEWVEWT